jgi:putative transposase
MAHRYHRHLDSGGLALPGGGPRCLFTAHRWLGDGFSSGRKPGGRGLAYGTWLAGAYCRTGPPFGRGSQYTSLAYQAVLAQSHIQVSMSRKGDCYDNAMMESFFSSLKTECVNRQPYRSCSEAKLSIFEYIEVFYNRQRRHSSLAYMSPVVYEQQCSHV